MIRLSAAMIVKNEAKNLERCLKSIKDVVDEIIIVDTGSTDATVEIAKKFTDKIYHQAWEDDFAKHRNYSFSLATGDWVFQIDADEEFFFQPGADFRDFLDKVSPEINAIAMTLRDWSDQIQTFAGQADVIRVFRAGKVTYRRRIHNEPIFDGIAGYLSNCWIKHYGYNMTPEEQAAKAKRTIRLLEQCIAEDPDDHDSYFYLASAELRFANNSDKALAYGLEYCSRREKMGEKFNTSIFHTVASILIRKRQFDQAFKLIQSRLMESTTDVDMCWDLMTLGIETKNNGLTLTGADAYLKAMQAFSTGKSRSGMLGNIFYFHIDPHSYAAASYWFAILHIELGITHMRKLGEYAKLYCKPKVTEEIASRRKEDFNRLEIVDKTQSRIILPENGGRVGVR